MKLIKKSTVREHYRELMGHDHDAIYAQNPERAEAYIKEGEARVNPREDGEEVWEYNDIRFLSGTSGICTVKDGQIVRMFATMMS